MVRTSTTVLSSALLASSAMAGWSKPEPVCEVVTVTYTGAITWVPDPTWSDWVTTTTKTKSKPVAPTSTVTETWGDWDPATVTETWVDWTTADPTTTETWVDWTTADPTTTETWVDWTTADPTTVTETWTDWVDPTHKHKTTTTTTTTETWGDWDTTAAPTTTPTTTPSWPKTTTTTSVAPPAAAPTCPSDGGKTVFPGGSCGCGFAVNCGVHADVGASAVFWEQTSGALYATLAECLDLCDNNADCTAAIWTDDPTNGDYHHCWQTSGLGGIISAGVGQISYKGSCSGSCSAAYNS